MAEHDFPPPPPPPPEESTVPSSQSSESTPAVPADSFAIQLAPLDTSHDAPVKTPRTGTASARAFTARNLKRGNTSRRGLKRDESKWGLISDTNHKAQHVLSLLAGLVTLLLNLAEVAAHAFLFAYYFSHDRPYSAIALLVIYGFTSIIHILFDYLNRGRLKFILADFLQVRILFEFIEYCIQFHHNYGSDSWERFHFRPAQCFESLVVTFPSLIIQTYVLIDVRSAPSWEQYFCLIVTAVNAFMLALHYFKHVTVSTTTYSVMCLKAVFNTALRTVLCAYLIEYLQAYILVWIAGSYIIGLIIYWSAVTIARKKQRDDPLHYMSCHLFYGNFCALTALFISFPFAPTHAVTDWWRGYLVTEIKMEIESLAGTLIVLYRLYETESTTYFAVVTGFAGAMFIASFVTTGFLHVDVRKQLIARGRYSNALIADLFQFLFAHHKARMADRELVWQKHALSLVSQVAIPTDNQRRHSIHPAMLQFDEKKGEMVAPPTPSQQP